MKTGNGEITLTRKVSLKLFTVVEECPPRRFGKLKFATGICSTRGDVCDTILEFIHEKATSFASLAARCLSEGIRGSTVNKNIFSPFLL